MENYVTGSMIRNLREQKQITQSQLANLLMVSPKTISKWETGKGFPDISLIEPLSKALGVSVIELLNGQMIENHNVSSNLLKSSIYVCPVCGNVFHSIGNGVVSCCGITLIKEEPQKDEENRLEIEEMEGELYVHLHHEMTKMNYISFIAYVTGDRFEFIKLYPEMEAEARFFRRGGGILYYYSNLDGLFMKRI